LKQGRIKVRAFGIHPPVNTGEVETEDLPWAYMINGTGGSFYSIPEAGDWVFGFFMDGRDAQHPFIIGVVHGSHLAIPYDKEITSSDLMSQVVNSGETSGNLGKGTGAVAADPKGDNSELGTNISQRVRNMTDREVLARTIEAEARGESYEGKVAVGAVIANRVNNPNRYNSTIKGVILADGHFSAWNIETGYLGGKGGISNIATKDIGNEYYEIADRIISGDYTSIAGDADHYYNPSEANPSWGKDRLGGTWVREGNHIFGYGNGK